MNEFLWGLLAAGCLVCALLFVRFWRLSRERLLLFFAAAFVALALNWTVLGLMNPPEETRHYAYFVRLLAFVLLIAGILDKNRRSARTGT
jgi:uncharacterized membrane protein